MDNQLFAFNNNNFFKPIELDVFDFMYDTELHPYSDESAKICSSFVIDAKHRAGAYDVDRRKRVRPSPRINRLAFPTKQGYIAYSNYSCGQFFIRLFNLCRAHGLFEPKLLINHSLEQPLYSRVFPNEKIKRNIKISGDYCKLFHQFIKALVSRSELEDVSVYAHKDTTPGPPFSFYGFQPYQKDDVLFGVEEDMVNRVVAALKRDYSVIKSSYLPHAFEIHSEQREIAEIGLSNYQGCLIDLYKRCILPTSIPGFRKNSIDKAEIEDRDVDIKERFYSKDRNFGLFTRKGYLSGKINNKKLTDFCNQKGKFPYSFSTNRSREITCISWPSQISASVSSRMVLNWIEHSVNGFAGNRPEVMYSYKTFCDYAKSHGYKLLFCNGDRRNAESFITTNYSSFRDLILPNLRKLYDFQNSTVMFAEQIYYIKGLPSGMARTTELNWYVGTYEALYSLSILVRRSICDVASAYFNSVLASEDFFFVDDYIVKLFMPTDDIPLIIGHKGELSTDSLSKLADEREMEWSFSDTGMVTFGMEFDCDGMRPAQVSVISKLFYSEHPGFFARDCFSLVSKLKMLPQDLKYDILRLYNSYFDTDLSLLERYSEGFLSWLRALGVNIEAVIDLYSPSSRVIFSDLVDPESIKKSSRVDSSYLESIYTDYKTIFKE